MFMSVPWGGIRPPTGTVWGRGGFCNHSALPLDLTHLPSSSWAHRCPSFLWTLIQMMSAFEDDDVRGWKNQKRRLDSASLGFCTWGNWEPKTDRQWVRAPDQTLVPCLLFQCIPYCPQKKMSSKCMAPYLSLLKNKILGGRDKNIVVIVQSLIPTLCNSMDCSTPDFTVLHQLLELAQTHIHWVGEAIQTISSSVIPFSFCLQSFSASGSFLTSCLLASGGQSIGASASASVLPMNIQGWFPLGLTGLISLQSKGLSKVHQHHSSEISVLWCSKRAFFMDQLSHLYMTTGKTIVLTRRTFVCKVMSLLFNMLSRLVIAFLPRSKGLLFHGCSHQLRWFWSPRK